MAYCCSYCGKKPSVGHKVSHSNIKTKIRHMPNLQRVRVSLEGTSRRVWACTRCIRTGRVFRPVFRTHVANPSA